MMIDLKLLEQIKCSNELINWFKNRLPEKKNVSFSELDLLLNKSGNTDLAIELREQLLLYFSDHADVVRYLTDTANEYVKSGIRYYGPGNVGNNKVYSESPIAEIISRENHTDILSEGGYAAIHSYGYNNCIHIKGDNSVATARNVSTVLNSGINTTIELRGDVSDVFSSGAQASVNSYGRKSYVVSSGNYSVIRNSGDISSVVASGYSSQIFNTGNNAILAVAASSRVVNSGANTLVGCSGDSSVVFNYGKEVKISVTGQDSVVVCVNDSSLVRLGKNCCAAFKWYDGNRFRIRVLYEGEDGIKPDTWYRIDYYGDVREATRKEIDVMDNSIQGTER